MKINRQHFKIVPNEKKYHEFIRIIRNDKRVKRGFIEHKNITKKQQIKYMKKFEKNYFICLCGKTPAGYIGVIGNDIRVATHPDFQGKGIGLFMVNYIKKRFKRVQAKIKIDNNASINLFKKAGFKLKYYIFE